MNPRNVQRWLSRLSLLLAGLGGLYLWMRYEVMTLPSAGCSPLARLAPGSFLWIDLHPSDLAVGDVLFYELPGGALGIAEVERVQQDSYWLVTDVESCPAQTSATLGWIAADKIHGRLILGGRL